MGSALRIILAEHVERRFASVALSATLGSTGGVCRALGRGLVEVTIRGSEGSLGRWVVACLLVLLDEIGKADLVSLSYWLESAGGLLGAGVFLGLTYILGSASKYGLRFLRLAYRRTPPLVAREQSSCIYTNVPLWLHTSVCFASQQLVVLALVGVVEDKRDGESFCRRRHPLVSQLRCGATSLQQYPASHGSGTDGVSLSLTTQVPNPRDRPPRSASRAAFLTVTPLHDQDGDPGG